MYKVVLRKKRVRMLGDSWPYGDLAIITGELDQIGPGGALANSSEPLLTSGQQAVLDAIIQKPNAGNLPAPPAPVKNLSTTALALGGGAFLLLLATASH